MAKARVISGTEDQPKVVAFVCPGCDEEHQVFIQPPEGFTAKWEFNGDYDAPTFKPSLKIQYTKYENGFQNYKIGDKTEAVTCHCVITHGNILFCGDSTHKLAGQAVQLPDINT